MILPLYKDTWKHCPTKAATEKWKDVIKTFLVLLHNGTNTERDTQWRSVYSYKPCEHMHSWTNTSCTNHFKRGKTQFKWIKWKSLKSWEDWMKNLRHLKTIYFYCLKWFWHDTVYQTATLKQSKQHQLHNERNVLKSTRRKAADQRASRALSFSFKYNTTSNFTY